MTGRIVKGDKIRPLDGKFKGQEGSVVDVYDNPMQRVRVRFPDNSLQIYDRAQVELTYEKFNFKRFTETL